MRTFETIVDRIGNTRTAAGLRVPAQLDRGLYPTGVKVFKAQMDRIALKPETFRREWNYTLIPGEVGSLISISVFRFGIDGVHRSGGICNGIRQYTRRTLGEHPFGNARGDD